MMYTNPFYHPYFRPRYSYPYYSNPSSRPTTPIKQEKSIETRETKKECEEEEKEERQFFDIMGIRLYFDDILLICLIFFLYQEGVKDQTLFISLILLLLS